MKSFKPVLVLMLLAIFPYSCGLVDSVNEIKSELTQLREQSVLALNDGINALQNSSSDVLTVLKDVEGRMDKRIQDVLTYNIPYITNLASQRLLSSVLCIKESVKDEAIYYLQVARAELITGILPPLPHTKICLTSVSTIDLNAPRGLRNQVIYTGYYIHTQDSIKAFLVNGANSIEIPKDKLGFPDISNITVSLVNYSDDVLKLYTHLQLRYNKTVISAIGIDPVRITPPVIETAYTRRETMVFIPPHTYGDREFGGNGPKMISHLYLRQDGNRVYAQVYLSARETRSDWTTAEGSSQWVEIYTVRSGYKINRLLDNTTYLHLLRASNGADYVDTNHEDHIMETTVGRATLVGDTSGDEAGSRTKITLNLKTFAVEIQKL
jgi:hypothetical protein